VIRPGTGPSRRAARGAEVATCALVGLAALAGCADNSGPRLLTVTPATAGHNARVTVTGSRLCGAPADCTSAAGAFDLGLEPPMVRATVVGYSDTAAQIVIPAAAPVGATALTVTVNERSSNALAFEVLP
jgi:hypothetical protein